MKYTSNDYLCTSDFTPKVSDFFRALAQISLFEENNNTTRNKIIEKFNQIQSDFNISTDSVWSDIQCDENNNNKDIVELNRLIFTIKTIGSFDRKEYVQYNVLLHPYGMDINTIRETVE